MDLKETFLRRFSEAIILPIFKKVGFPAEGLTLFRVLFALLTAGFILLGDFYPSLIMISIYQLIFLLDYVDGKLARSQGRFSEKWVIFDRVSHYFIATIFFSSVLFSQKYILNSSFFFFGFLGFISLVFLTFIELFSSSSNNSESINKHKKIPFYSFIGIDNSFSIFYLLFVFKIHYLNIFLYSFIYLFLLIRRLK